MVSVVFLSVREDQLTKFISIERGLLHGEDPEINKNEENCLAKNRTIGDIANDLK